MLKKYRGWLILVLLLLLSAGGIWLTLRVTAEYPALGELVSYPVNQVKGFELTISEPVWSPFTGYTLDYNVSADSEEVYYFIKESEKPDFEYLEHYVDGQWYRLGYTQDYFSPSSIDFALGGEEGSGLEGSIVQKYAYYGTRLESGLYRVTLEIQAGDGTPYYLSSEFHVK